MPTMPWVIPWRIARAASRRPSIWLEKALKLEPEDPFILDSMGWALFKAKRYAESVDYLRRAYGARPDPEIAAHFGEALWMKGDKEEARRVWRNGLQLHPDNESLRDVASRLMH